MIDVGGMTVQSSGRRGFTFDSRYDELIQPRVTNSDRPSGITSDNLIVKSVLGALDVAKNVISAIPVTSVSSVSGAVVKVNDSASSTRWSGRTR